VCRPWEHVFVTSQVPRTAASAAAIQHKHVANAEDAARELGWLSLVDALACCELVAEVQPERFDRVAVRWHGRLALEASGLSLRDSETALALLALLPTDPEAGRLLRRLLGRTRPAPQISRNQTTP
jgi:hypothetical protein